MTFVTCHIWVEMNARTFKVVFKDNGIPSYIMEWRRSPNGNGKVFVRYWSRSRTHSKPTPGGLAARLIAAAEEIRGV